MSIRNSWRGDFSPRDRRPIYDWARDTVDLQPPFSITGPFEVNNSRHFIAPFDALLDPCVREVNICAPVRDGKTLIADLWLPWTILNDPGAFLGLFQKDDVAQQHCETRTWRILESIPQIKSMLDALDRHDARTQEIIFEDPIYIWGPSTKNLQSKAIRYLWMDEVWQIKKGIIREAKARLGDALKLGLDKTLITSQGGQKQMHSADLTDEWWKQFEAGELNVWEVQCRDCGKYHAPALAKPTADRKHRAGLVWDEHRDERGLWNLSRAIESLRYVCPACAAVFPLSEQARVRAAWNRTGKHVRVGEEKRVKKSFTNNGLINYPWEFLASEFLTARNAAALGDRTHTIQFFQKYMAEFHDTQAHNEFEQLPTIEIEIISGDTNQSGRAQAPAIKWKDPDSDDEITFLHRDLMIDVQLRELYAVASAWSDQGDDLTLEARILSGQPEEQWKLARAMQLEWQVLDQDVGLDINYDERAKECAEEICRHGHFEGLVWRQWVGYRGDKKPNFPWHPKGRKLRLLPVVMDPKLVERIDPAPGVMTPQGAPDFFATDSAGTTFKKFCLVFKWSKPTITSILETRRDGRAKGIRSVTLKGDWNELFFKHMHGERWRLKEKNGYQVHERYGAARHDFADGKKMSIAHAIRKGRLNFGSETEGSKEEKKESSSAE